MIVLHIITGLNRGGAEFSLLKILLSDTEWKKKSVIISLTDVGELGSFLLSRGFKVYSLKMNKLLKAPSAIIRLITIIKKINPDIVHTWMYHADFVGGLASRFCGIKNIVWSIRRSTAPPKSSMTYYILLLCAKTSNWIPRKIVCVAKSAAKNHISYGYFKEKIVVIHNGIDFDKLKGDDFFDFEFKLPSNTIIIGCIGRFHYDKGQDLLVKASRKIIEENSRVIFVLVGKGCDYSNKCLVDLLIKEKVINNYYLMGEQKNVFQFLSSFDIYCMPSRTEGFPNALLEAMAMKLPCISTNVGDAEFILGQTGFLVDKICSDCIYMELKKVINMSQKERLNIGDNSAKRVREFSIDVMTNQYINLYADIVDKS
ncbi:glycosyltransferase [Zooshikella ganghwensis]|uniref:Glycosyltransferase n=2 Tax=Zooshikella ganghwensis TaxID=202772 RepID=A0A4P9VKZ3_9GAMM|nr:glycosyltransferase [Zooshikella ganghwensis]